MLSGSCAGEDLHLSPLPCTISIPCEGPGPSAHPCQLLQPQHPHQHPAVCSGSGGHHCVPNTAGWGTWFAGTSWPWRTSTCTPVSRAMPAKHSPTLIAPGTQAMEKLRHGGTHGGERGGLTSPSAALRAEEEQQTPEEEGEGSCPGKHRGDRRPAASFRCPGASVPVPAGAAARCPGAGPGAVPGDVSVSVPGDFAPAVGARRCRGLSPGVGCLVPVVPVPRCGGTEMPVPRGAGAEDACARGCRFPAIQRCRCRGCRCRGAGSRGCRGADAGSRRISSRSDQRRLL